MQRRRYAKRLINRKENTFMGIITWIVLGLVAGWLAGRFMRGGYGLVGVIVLGIVGAVSRNCSCACAAHGRERQVRLPHVRRRAHTRPTPAAGLACVSAWRGR